MYNAKEKMIQPYSRKYNLWKRHCVLMMMMLVPDIYTALKDKTIYAYY